MLCRVPSLGDDASGVGLIEYMSYRGRMVEVFGRTPTGQPVPRLHGDVDGTTVGDYAFINGAAMKWDGEWAPSLWKDFAAWKTAER